MGASEDHPPVLLKDHNQYLCPSCGLPAEACARGHQAEMVRNNNRETTDPFLVSWRDFCGQGNLLLTWWKGYVLDRLVALVDHSLVSAHGRDHHVWTNDLCRSVVPKRVVTVVVEYPA